MVDRYKLTPVIEGVRPFRGLWVPPIKKIETRTYTIKEGDRIDLLAQQSLGDFRLWWVIAYINGLDDPLELPVGKEIVLPIRVEFFE
jgi:hypothetical protein